MKDAMGFIFLILYMFSVVLVLFSKFDVINISSDYSDGLLICSFIAMLIIMAIQLIGNYLQNKMHKKLKGIIERRKKAYKGSLENALESFSNKLDSKTKTNK